VACVERAALVLYDEDCRFCTSAAEALARWGVPVAPIGSPLGEEWLRDLDRPARYAEFHAVDRAGRRFSGGEALPLVLVALPGGGLLARLARALPGTTRLAYRAIARNRSLLSRLI